MFDLWKPYIFHHLIRIALASKMCTKPTTTTTGRYLLQQFHPQRKTICRGGKSHPAFLCRLSHVGGRILPCGITQNYPNLFRNCTSQLHETSHSSALAKKTKLCEVLWADWRNSETKKPPADLIGLPMVLMAASSTYWFSLWVERRAGYRESIRKRRQSLASENFPLWKEPAEMGYWHAFCTRILLTPFIVFTSVA